MADAPSDRPARQATEVTEVTDAATAIAVVREVDAALVEADGAGVVDEAGWRDLDHRGLTDARLWAATAADGSPAGFALLRRVGGTHDLGLAVAPTHRGAGLGTALLDGALERGLVATGGRVLAWSHADHPAARHLAAARGFAPVRELLVMERGPHDLPPLPARSDVTVRAYRPDSPADAEAVLAINTAAFAAHPEQGAMDARDLAERMAQDWFDPAGLLLAQDAASGEVLGFHWTKRTRATGEVYVVGIAPAAQGRGLGKLVTLAGLHHLAAHGVERIELYVEGDNAPARAVYAGLGFTVAATHVQYARG
ncbi:mycothiol synthase [Nocardioides zeae]|uniref:Mycothiol acetyltransferase n=1 Tax=Nocardioides imazamoxiresistens TaxID=3231893 RepID=A0ABU3Q184_9ACTN|nr:mycothiol synthase [Nocardioides zeae]MDT9594780.1 mycothiol synthase [Nocardioides zeae]